MGFAYTPFLLTLGACHNFTSVDDACKSKVIGEKHIAHSSSAEALLRINCYRRLAKVGVITVDKIVQATTEDHVDYMNALDDFNVYSPGIEDSANPGYTGVTLNDRLEAKNWAGDVRNLDRWELTPWNWPFSGADNVDYLFPDPWVRQIYLQPTVIAGGFDEGLSGAGDSGWTSYTAILYRQPTGHAPFVYPVDGQTGIDPSYYDQVLGGALVEYGEIGYPITITVDASVIVLRDFSLSGPSGDVDTVVNLPGDVSWGSSLRGTVAITPLDALEPSSEYTFNATVEWDGAVSKLESIFTTGAINTRPATEYSGSTSSYSR